MGDFDEYDELERRLEGGQPGAPAFPSKLPEGALQEQPAGDDRRGKDRNRDRERRRSPSRSRSRSRERRRGERERDRDPKDDRRGRDDRRDRNRDDRRREDRKENDRGRMPERRDDRRRRDRTPEEVRLQREREKEMREMERSLRTVLATNINLRAEEFDLLPFFSRAGTVVDVKLITDKNTRRHRGFAYIEFEKQEQVLHALALTGQPLLGQPVIVRSSEHNKNLEWERKEEEKKNAAAAAQLLRDAGAQVTTLPTSGPLRLHVGNLNPEITDTELNDLFAPFGQLEYAQVAVDALGRSQMYGFVQFASPIEGAKAMAHYNGKEIAGAKLAVTIAPAGAALAPVMQPAVNLAAVPPQFGVPGMALPGPPPLPTGAGLAPGMPAAAGPGAAAAAMIAAQYAPPGADAAAAIAPKDTSISELDDEEESKGGLKLNSNIRQALMNRLASSAGLQPLPAFQVPGAAPAGAPAAAAQPAVRLADPSITLERGLLGPSSPTPTQCIMLKNLFSPEEESGDDWDKEIAEDVAGECAKWGQLLHIHVEKNSRGHVYLKFATVEAASAAQRSLHGRYFASRQIAAEFQFVHMYAQVFGA